MRRLTEPKHLFLYFRQPRKPHLHAKVAAGHHDPDSRTPQCLEQEARELLEGTPGLNLEDDAQMAAMAFLKSRQQLVHVFRLPQEGEPHHVCMGNDEVEILPVLLGKRRKVHFSVRKVDAPVTAELALPGTRVCDLDAEPFRRDLSHDTPELAVVEEDPLLWPNVRKDFGQRAADHRRSQDDSHVVCRGGLTHLDVACQEECVADRESQCLGNRRDLAHRPSAYEGAAAVQVHPRLGTDIDIAVGFRTVTAIGHSQDCEGTRSAAHVVEAQLVPVLEAAQERPVERQHRS